MRALRASLLAGLLAALALPAAPVRADAPEQTALSAQELRILGYRLLEAGDIPAAESVAGALLARDPRDDAALMLRAQTRLARGDGSGARADGRKVYRLADSRNARFGAALFVANALVEDGHNSLGQLWLRRAAQAAPDAESRALVARDYDHVRSRNPWLWNFTLRIAPSNNVNDGSSEASYDNPGIPWLAPEIEIDGAQKALSGMETVLGFAATYRLPPGPTTMTALEFRAQQSIVTLSDEAKALAPGLRGADYNTATVEAGLTRRIRPEGGSWTYALGVWAGHDWAGGASLSNSLRLEAQADRPFGASLAGMAALSFERQWRLDSAVRSADVLAVTFGVQKRLANRDRLQLTLGGRQTDSDSPGLRYHAVNARLSWDKAQPVAGIGLGAALTVEARDYPDSPFDPVDGRQDTRIALDVSLQHEDIQFYGFSPTLDLRAARNHSDVGLYSSRDLGLTLGFRSSF